MSTSTSNRFVILAAIDSSAAAEDVVATLARLSRAFAGAELHLLHAIDTASEADRATLGETPTDRQARHQKHLDRAVQRLHELGVPRPLEHLIEGTPRTVVLDVAAVLEADLILVGTHGRTGLNRLLLGSVAEGIVRSAHCPVLVAREKRYHAPFAPARG
jgi:nucleotide-binding universal stress UspA family protein